MGFGIKKLILFIVIVSLSGCKTLGYEEFYRQVAPIKYRETQKVMVFEYADVDLHEIYELLFNEYLIVGKSAFIGPYESPDDSIDYAKSIGADVLITTAQFKEKKIIREPKTKTIHSGTISGDSFYGTSETYRQREITINRYDQDGYYLRNVNNIIPLWERTRKDYKETGTSELSGIWHNERYELSIYQSDTKTVGIINAIKSDNETWRVDELKMIFEKDTGVGIYLMGNKTPIPAEFRLNKFGHIEVELITINDVFSFARR